MPVKYILFDKDYNTVKTWNKKVKKVPVTILHENVKNIKADIYVSPANGYGQLDGGIDKIYRSLFPGLQEVVNEKLSEFKGKNPLIGVGSALLIDIPKKNKQLLLAPTMELPSKLNNAWNVFWAALAIFYLTDSMELTVAIPGLCTGTGHVEPDEMMHMLEKAWYVHKNLGVGIVHPGARFTSGNRLILEQSMHEKIYNE